MRGLQIEMGMKNHEVVPLALVAAIAGVHRGAVSRALTELVKHDLAVHERGKQCMAPWQPLSLTGSLSLQMMATG